MGPARACLCKGVPEIGALPGYPELMIVGNIMSPEEEVNSPADNGLKKKAESRMLFAFEITFQGFRLNFFLQVERPIAYAVCVVAVAYVHIQILALHSTSN